MKKSSWGNGWRGIGLAAALVVPSYGLSHVSGVAEAEGCTGGTGAGAAPPGVTLDRSSGLQVATDGFFLLNTFLDPYVALASANVTVTTTDGQAVPGALKVFSGSSTYVGWQASAPLAVGTKLEVVVSSVPGSFSFSQDEAEYSVVGAPTSLEGAEVSLGAWYDLHHGVGESANCYGQATQCRDIALIVYGREELLHAVDVAWKGMPKVNGFVLWEASVEPSEDEIPLSQLNDSTQFSDAQPAGLGRLAFPTSTAQYCATVKVRDLRSDQQVKVRTCGEPQSGEVLRDYDEVKECSAPPAGPLAQIWCAAHPESQLAECRHVDAVDPMRPRDSDPLANDNAANHPRARTSSACEFSPAPARGACIGFVVVALALAGALRRRVA